MCTIEKEIEKYLSEIQNNLICNSKAKKNIIEEISGSVYDFAEAKGINDISEIYEHFGTPEEMARTYLSQSDPKKIAKAVRIKKAVVIGVIVAILLFAISLIIAIIDSHRSNDGHYIDTVIETNEFDDEHYVDTVIETN